MQERPPTEQREISREPRNTAEARRAITQTRSRISQDLDAIEGRIVEKRDELKAKADVLKPARRRIRERPWPSLAVALGTGVVLGMIGGDEEAAEPTEETRRKRRRHYRAERRDRLRGRRRAARKRRRARADGRMGSSTAGMLGGAVLSGLTTRFKRFGRNLLAGRR